MAELTRSDVSILSFPRIVFGGFPCLSGIMLVPSRAKPPFLEEFGVFSASSHTLLQRQGVFFFFFSTFSKIP